MMLNEQEARELLPGSGDLADMVNKVLDSAGFVTFKGAKFSVHDGELLLQKIIEYIVGEP